MTRNTITIYP